MVKSQSKNGGKTSTNFEESMMTSITQVKASSKKRTKVTRKSSYLQESGGKRETFKDMHKKRYPFSNSDVPKILHDLLQAELIELPRSRHPEEFKQVDNPNY